MDQRVALGKYFGESIKDEEKNRPTRGWNRPGLRPGGKAHGVFDGACCILNLHVQSRPGGSTASRWALEKEVELVNTMVKVWDKLSIQSKSAIIGSCIYIIPSVIAMLIKKALFIYSTQYQWIDYFTGIIIAKCFVAAAINPLYLFWRIVIMLLGCGKNQCNNLIIMKLHILIGVQYHFIFTLLLFGISGYLLTKLFNSKKGLITLLIIYIVLTVIGGTFYYVMNEVVSYSG
jgi:cation transporter-like permease